MDTIDKLQFIWWQGVVEDRNDPLQLGRCRVRILLWHPQNKAAVKTEDLPWAHPMQPIISAAMSGIGYSPVGPVEGTWVFGFFRDGDNAQEPIIMGTFGGIPQEAPPVGSNGKVGVGFHDPNGKYPLHDRSAEVDAEFSGGRSIKGTFTQHDILEPDTNRLARTDGTQIFGRKSQTHPVTVQKLTDLKIPDFPGVPHEGLPVRLANSPETWDEPFTAASNSTYPFNHVRETESGHIQEFDDTEGSERIHTFHKSGTFEEWHPEGDSMRKIVGTDFEIVEGDDDLLVKGNLNITVKQKARIRVNGLVDIEAVEGDIRVVIRKGNAEVQVQQGNANVLVQGNLAVEVNGNMTERIAGNYNIEVGGTYRLVAGQVTIRGGTIFLN